MERVDAVAKVRKAEDRNRLMARLRLRLVTMVRRMADGPVLSVMAAVLLPALLCNCSRPDTVDIFVGSRAADKSGGAYVMTLDMSDTLAAYSLTLYTRLDCRSSKFAVLEAGIPVEALWTSPDGTLYSESFEIPKEAYCASTAFSRSYHIPYRSGLKPNLPGVWTLSFKMGGKCAKNFNGIGLIFETDREE